MKKVNQKKDLFNDKLGLISDGIAQNPDQKNDVDNKEQHKEFRKNYNREILNATLITYVVMLVFGVSTVLVGILSNSPWRLVYIIVAMITVFIIFIVMGVKHKFNPAFPLGFLRWAEKNNLSYDKKNLDRQLIFRIEANQGKKILKSLANRIKNNTFKFKGPFIYGTIQGRKVWLYRAEGNLSVNVQGYQVERIYMEIETHKIPERLMVYKHLTEFWKIDELDVESKDFNFKYGLDIEKGCESLQLLDPNMIEILTKFKLTAIEFSDSSVLLCEIIELGRIDAEIKLDIFLHWGLEIAEQVDRNFPMGKYEKK